MKNWINMLAVRTAAKSWNAPWWVMQTFLAVENRTREFALSAPCPWPWVRRELY